MSSGSSEDELTRKLKDLLKADGLAAPGGSAASSPGTPDYYGVRSKKRTPPTLAQLRQSGQYREPDVVRDVTASLTEEQLEDRKRELLFKFDMLRRQYRGSVIPEYTIHSDYKAMTRQYEETIRRLTLEGTVESYKTYLIGAFMLVEYVLGNWLKFDMQGYTQQQIMSMSSYEKLLVEIGEKSYVPEAEQWPVEFRLLFLVIVNAVFFIVSKMILRKTGSNVMGMMNEMFGKDASPQPPASSGAPPHRPKRKMRGPTVNLDEIPEMK